MIININKAVRVEIAKLELKPGDTLVVNVDFDMTVEMYKRMNDQLSKFVPVDIKTLVLAKGIRLSKLENETANDAN